MPKVKRLLCYPSQKPQLSYKEGELGFVPPSNSLLKYYKGVKRIHSSLSINRMNQIWDSLKAGSLLVHGKEFCVCYQDLVDKLI